MSLSGRYPEHDICENFNAIDVRELDPLEPFPQKPRGIHWRTYRRLRNEAKTAKAEADYLLAQSLPGLAQLLDLVPPRQKRERGRRDGRPKPPSAAGPTSTPSRPNRLDRP